MKWYQLGIDKSVLALVLLCGLTCLVLGIFWGKSIGERKHKTHTSVSVIVEVDTLLLDRWQLFTTPIQTWGRVSQVGLFFIDSINIEYKIKAYEKKDIDTASVDYQLQNRTIDHFIWNPETKKWEELKIERM